MNTFGIRMLRTAILRSVGAAVLALGLTLVAGEPQTKFDFLITPAGAFSNVVVVTRTVSHVSIQSDQGMAVLKMGELDSNTQARLKGEYVPPPTVSTEPGAAPAEEGGQASAANDFDSEQMRKMQENLRKYLAPEKIAMFFTVVIGVALVIHLFISYCLMLICKKTGNEPGFMVWLPILQQFPMLRAASMSYWWFLANFIPVVNLVAWVIWCGKITTARGKGALTTILLILPVTNFFAFLYLAFSSGADYPAEAGKQTRPG